MKDDAAPPQPRKPASALRGRRVGPGGAAAPQALVPAPPPVEPAAAPAQVGVWVAEPWRPGPGLAAGALRTAQAVQAAQVAAAPQPAVVLAKATARSAALLGLSGAALARVIGLSEPTVSRLLRGERGLAPDSKEGELAALLVRVYRSLDALVGNDDGKRLAWMGSPNRALGGVPRELVQRVEGLVATLAYLDGLRAPA